MLPCVVPLRDLLFDGGQLASVDAAHGESAWESEMRQTAEDVLRSLRIRAAETGPGIIRIGDLAIRYALVLVTLWIGCLKFTAYESARDTPCTFILRCSLSGDRGILQDA